MREFEATWITEIELSEPLADFGVDAPAGSAYRQARILVRLHRRPVGFVTGPVANGVVDTEALRPLIWETLGPELCAHLRSDGLEAPAGLSAEGLAGSPACAAGRGGLGAPLVSVVICTRDRPDSLAACLEAVRALRYGPFEVIVVDNAPATDATRDVFAQRFAGDSRFRYVIEPGPGLSRARNRGLFEARGRIVAFTDDDVRVDQWWLDGIAEGFARDGSPACVTGLVAPGQLDSLAQLYFDQRMSWGSSCERRTYDLDTRRPESPLYPYAAGLFGTGANFAFDRKALIDLGGFDEALGAGSRSRGGEDLDIFVRALRAGHVLAYEPAALVWHAHRVESSELRTQLFHYGTGLSAFMTKCLTDRRTARDVIVRLPAGVRHARGMLRPSGRPSAGDRNLVVAEVLGMAAGPVAYFRARRQARNIATAKDRTWLS